MLNKNIPYIGENVKTPSSTGKSTLSEYVKELATNKNRFGYIVVSGFSDLPRTDWGFTLELVSVNSLYVKIHRSLSNGEYYIRGMSYDYQWVGDWQKFLTNSDLPKLYYRIEDAQNAGNPIEAIKNKWATMPDGNYICEIYVGSLHTALFQKIENGTYGSLYIISYGLATPIYMRKIKEEWIVK